MNQFPLQKKKKKTQSSNESETSRNAGPVGTNGTGGSLSSSGYKSEATARFGILNSSFQSPFEVRSGTNSNANQKQINTQQLITNLMKQNQQNNMIFFQAPEDAHEDDFGQNFLNDSFHGFAQNDDYPFQFIEDNDEQFNFAQGISSQGFNFQNQYSNFTNPWISSLNQSQGQQKDFQNYQHLYNSKTNNNNYFQENPEQHERYYQPQPQNNEKYLDELQQHNKFIIYQVDSKLQYQNQNSSISQYSQLKQKNESKMVQSQIQHNQKVPRQKQQQESYQKLHSSIIQILTQLNQEELGHQIQASPFDQLQKLVDNISIDSVNEVKANQIPVQIECKNQSKFQKSQYLQQNKSPASNIKKHDNLNLQQNKDKSTLESKKNFILRKRNQQNHSIQSNQSIILENITQQKENKRNSHLLQSKVTEITQKRDKLQQVLKDISIKREKKLQISNKKEVNQINKSCFGKNTEKVDNSQEANHKKKKVLQKPLDCNKEDIFVSSAIKRHSFKDNQKIVPRVRQQNNQDQENGLSKSTFISEQIYPINQSKGQSFKSHNSASKSNRFGRKSKKYTEKNANLNYSTNKSPIAKSFKINQVITQQIDQNQTNQKKEFDNLQIFEKNSEKLPQNCNQIKLDKFNIKKRNSKFGSKANFPEKKQTISKYYNFQNSSGKSEIKLHQIKKYETKAQSKQKDFDSLSKSSNSSQKNQMSINTKGFSQKILLQTNQKQKNYLNNNQSQVNENNIKPKFQLKLKRSNKFNINRNKIQENNQKRQKEVENFLKKENSSQQKLKQRQNQNSQRINGGYQENDNLHFENKLQFQQNSIKNDQKPRQKSSKFILSKRISPGFQSKNMNFNYSANQTKFKQFKQENGPDSLNSPSNLSSRYPQKFQRENQRFKQQTSKTVPKRFNNHINNEYSNDNAQLSHEIRNFQDAATSKKSSSMIPSVISSSMSHFNQEILALLDATHELRIRIERNKMNQEIMRKKWRSLQTKIDQTFNQQRMKSFLKWNTDG